MSDELEIPHALSNLVEKGSSAVHVAQLDLRNAVLNFEDGRLEERLLR